MKTSFFLILLPHFFFNQVSAATTGPAEIYQIEKAVLTFNTYVRVEVPARVVEAEDRSLVGGTTTFIQSLLYSGTKAVPFQGTYFSENLVQIGAQNMLCAEVQELDLSPFREGGTKGGNILRQKLRPSFATLTGTYTRDEKTKPISVTVSCNK